MFEINGVSLRKSLSHTVYLNLTNINFSAWQDKITSEVQEPNVSFLIQLSEQQVLFL